MISGAGDVAWLATPGTVTMDGSVHPIRFTAALLVMLSSTMAGGCSGKSSFSGTIVARPSVSSSAEYVIAAVAALNRGAAESVEGRGSGSMSGTEWGEAVHSCTEEWDQHNIVAWCDKRQEPPTLALPRKGGGKRTGCVRSAPFASLDARPSHPEIESEALIADADDSDSFPPCGGGKRTGCCGLGNSPL